MEPPTIFPKMEQHFDLHELLYLEDHLYLQSVGCSSFEDAIIPSYPSDNANFKFEFSPNCLLPYSTSTFSFYDQSQMNLENLELADFELWDEFPPLSEDNAAFQPISQLPLNLSSPLPFTNDTSYYKPFSFDTNFNDQSLSAVVAEGYTMPRKSVKIEDDFSSEHQDITRIKGNDSNDNSAKVAKIESISYEEIRKYFDKPISKAAKELNVGLTVLKKRCRELNIKRWPHRKIKSLEALIHNVKEQGKMDIVEALEEHKKKLQKMPGLELSHETKKLRQACFKANYKKRRALALVDY